MSAAKSSDAVDERFQREAGSRCGIQATGFATLLWLPRRGAPLRRPRVALALKRRRGAGRMSVMQAQPMAIWNIMHYYTAEWV